MRRSALRLSQGRLGLSLVELLVILSVVGLVVATAAPAWSNLRSRASVRISVDLLTSELRALRGRAISEGRSVGWSWRQSDASHFPVRMYIDGNGDGIHRADIAAGIDRPVGAERSLLPADVACVLGFPPTGVPDPSEPSTLLKPGSSPLRFGSTGIISFSPTGTSTPGSIFLTDTTGRAFCLRLYGGTARPHLLRWEPSLRRWLTEP